MTQRFSQLIEWGCTVILLAAPVAAVYFLMDIDAFAELARQNLRLPVVWQSVTEWQWYALWLATALSASVGYLGVFFLRKAFAGFANGELFNPANSRNLRRFAILLFVQGLARPVHFTVSGIVLSLNHPPGQKVLTVSFGSSELMAVALGMVLWVMSELLLKGGALESENRQFV